jgi:putative transposase
MRFSFIAEYKKMYPILVLCRVLRVSRSGFYSWRRRPESARSSENRRLLVNIGTIHATRRQIYGSPRIHAELRAQGWRCSRNRIARLMRCHGIRSKVRRQFRITTKTKPGRPIAPNLLKRRFKAAHPNQTWVADISYIRTREGWAYLAVLMDLFSRMIVGWALQDRLTASLAINALQMALTHRQPPANLMHHSDRGIQYASDQYRRILTSRGIRASMSRAGDCWDNAAIESLFGTIKSEMVDHRDYHTRAEARADVFDYIEVFYNRQRRHSSLGYLSPVDFEAATA